jgi:hypothetical protein
MPTTGRKNMPLQKNYVRGANRRILGSVGSGYSDKSEVVRDEQNQIVGRTSGRFETTRDESGSIVSTNTADPGLVIPRT